MDDLLALRETLLDPSFEESHRSPAIRHDPRSAPSLPSSSSRRRATEDRSETTTSESSSPADAAGARSSANSSPPPADTLVLNADLERRSLTRRRSKDEPAWLGGALFEQSLNAQAIGRDAQRAAARHGGDADELAQDVLEDFMATLAPRSRIERLLAMQMLWQHTRIGRLTMMEAIPKNLRLDIAKSLSQATDRAMSTFARQVRAWTALRAATGTEPSASSNELG